MTDKAELLAQCRTELAQIRQYLQGCETRIHQGEVIDLSSLGSQITKVCTDIQNLPMIDAQGLLTELDEIMPMLDKVEAEINANLATEGEA